MVESKRHTSKRDRRRFQLWVSDWEQEKIQKIAEIQGIAQADLVRDALRAIIGYFLPSEDWVYKPEWDLFWQARTEIEKAMNILAETVEASDPTDDLIDARAKGANRALTAITYRIAETRISGRKPTEEKPNASALLKWIIEGRRPTDVEIVEVCLAENLSEEKVFELRDRLFDGKGLTNGHA